MNLLRINKYASGWLPVAFLMFLITWALGSSGWAQTARRFISADGKAAVTYFNTAKPGEEDIYVINLKKGQSCEVDVEWQGEDGADEGQGLSGFTLIYPNGEKLVDAQDGHIQANHIQANTTGGYKIIVSPKTSKTNYRYRITFTQL